MNMEILEKFTNQEKITAFDIALKVAKEKNVGFNQTFMMVISQIVDSKKPKDNDVLIPVANEEVKTNVDDSTIQEEFQPDLTTLEAVLAKVREDRTLVHDELFREISDYTKAHGVFSPANDLAFMAGDGVIIDPNYIERFQLGPMDQQSLMEQASIKEKLLKYNEESRKLLYLSTKYRDKDSLEEMRLKTINDYKALIEKANNNLLDGTITVEEDSSNLSFSRMIDYLRREGRASKGGTVDTAFDELYSCSVSYATIGTNSIRSEKLYNQMLALLTERKEQLEHMSAEDFRNYKIALMSLSEEELTKYESDLRTKANTVKKEKEPNIMR